MLRLDASEEVMEGTARRLMCVLGAHLEESGWPAASASRKCCGLSSGACPRAGRLAPRHGNAVVVSRSHWALLWRPVCVYAAARLPGLLPLNLFRAGRSR